MGPDNQTRGISEICGILSSSHSGSSICILGLVASQSPGRFTECLGPCYCSAWIFVIILGDERYIDARTAVWRKDCLNLEAIALGQGFTVVI
jgi:hypothetical protein